MQAPLHHIEKHVRYKETNKHTLDTAQEIVTVEIAPKLVVSNKEKKRTKAQDNAQKENRKLVGSIN